jgi:hypothetical protein
MFVEWKRSTQMHTSNLRNMPAFPTAHQPSKCPMPTANRPSTQANIVPIDPNRRLNPGMLRLVEAPRWGSDSGGRRLGQCVSPRLL